MKDILHWLERDRGLTSIVIKRGEKNRPHGERRWMSSEDRNGAFIIGYSQKSGRRGNRRRFWWSLVWVRCFCHPHFRGNCLMIPDPSHMQTRPPAHSSPPTL